MESTGIGTGIRMQRERLGMSQQDLAQACMVSRQTISNWESGKTLPDIQSMAYLAEVFGVTVDDLVNQVAPYEGGTMESTGIGTGIRMQRERLGMSQQDLAQACMVSRQTKSNWETGKTLPDIQSMAYLAKGFGVTVDDLANQVAPELGERLGMSQQDLAQACMVSRQTKSNWETGKTLPDIQSMAYLAKGFGVTVDDLANQVAPELGKRVSVDKRELLLLTLGIIFIGVLYIPLEMVLERSDIPAPDIPAAAVDSVLFVGIVAIIVRMGMIFRKHNLSTDREIADYLVGNIHSAPQKKGFLRRHRFELSILLSVVACLALMVFAGEHWGVAFWIFVAVAIVLQVGFQLISR